MRSGKVVLLVENESAPTDKRVWNEACILREAGYDVTIVCPVGLGRDLEPVVEIDGITIRRFPLRRAAGGAVSYVSEYLCALWRMAWVVWRLDGPLRVIHAANPPDFLFVIALVPRFRWRTKLVFDHHDLVPELFQARFGGSAPALAVLRFVERVNFAVADAVVSTNESYRTIAIERGGKRPERVRVVRNARDPSVFADLQPDHSLKRGKHHLAVYAGVMGPQDGVAAAVRTAAHYRHDLGRDDLHVAMVGDGDAADDGRALARELDVADMVEFVGWLDHNEVLVYLASADVGLATDPPNPLNDRSTMIKVIEYLAAGLPVVSFDLTESIVTAGDAALYATGGDEGEVARHLARLIDDAELRHKLSRLALDRATGQLSWETAKAELLATYDGLDTRPAGDDGPPP